MQLSSYFIFLVNMIFAGRMTEETTAKMAAVGLGNLFLALCCRYILAGMNSAVETFVSQAYGQGELRLAGAFLNRGLVIMTAVYLTLVPILLAAKHIFIAVGVDAKVSAYSYEYMLPMIPALYLPGLFDLLRRFLIQV